MSILVMDTPVTRLALAHARSFELRRKFISAGTFLSGSVAHWSAGLFYRVAAAGLRRHNTYFQDQVVWFQGAAVAVDRQDRTHPLDADFSLIDRLHSMEDRLMKTRASLLDGAKRLSGRGKASETYREALLALAATAADLFEAVRDLRGATQALEADLSAQLRALRICTLPDELEAELARIIG